MFYRTRQMVADKTFHYDGSDRHAGDTFLASEVDAGYLTKHGRAHEVDEPLVVVERFPPLEQKPEVMAETPAEVAESRTDEAEPTVEVTTEVEPPRRRGRPRKAE